MKLLIQGQEKPGVYQLGSIIVSLTSSDQFKNVCVSFDEGMSVPKRTAHCFTA